MRVEWRNNVKFLKVNRLKNLKNKIFNRIKITSFERIINLLKQKRVFQIAIGICIKHQY
jgi:hypothetical protein